VSAVLRQSGMRYQTAKQYACSQSSPQNVDRCSVKTKIYLQVSLRRRYGHSPLSRCHTVRSGTSNVDTWYRRFFKIQPYSVAPCDCRTDFGFRHCAGRFRRPPQLILLACSLQRLTPLRRWHKTPAPISIPCII